MRIEQEPSPVANTDVTYHIEPLSYTSRDIAEWLNMISNKIDLVHSHHFIFPGQIM